MSVRHDRVEGVASITLDRPKALNSFDQATAEALRDAIQDAMEDEATRAIVLSGAGERAFCTGADIAAFRQALNDGPKGAQAAVDAVATPMNDAIHSLVTGPKPVVAAVNGVAAGGGLGLALACDLRVASQTARFLTAFMNVAVSPDAGTTWLLPRTVGWARAREMILTNPVLDAKQALEWGLITETATSDAVVEQAHKRAQTLAQGPRRTVAWAKKRLANQRPLEDHLAWEKEATVASAGTADFAEGLEAFFEKREPRFD